MGEGDARKNQGEDFKQAEWIASELKGSIRYDHTSKRWHIWNADPNERGGIGWREDKTEDVGEMVYLIAKEALTNGVLSESGLSLDEQKVYRKLFNVASARKALDALSWLDEYKTDGSDWDQQPELLGCVNGIVDLTKNELIPSPGPEVLVTKSTGHRFTPFDPAAQSIADVAPRFWKFLMEVTSGDQDLAIFYLLWFGYSLFGHTEEQRFLVMTGIGRNGKGALANAMRHVFGEYSAGTDQGIYMRNRFGSARSDGARADLMALKGKRIAIMSEPEGGEFNEELLKAHTGGDPITARALYSNNVISWTPTHSITFLTNQPPSVRDVGPAMAARVMVADFRERYDGDKQNKKLYSELEAESEGILSILCWAAKSWHDSKDGLDLPDRVVKASEAYLTANDPLAQAIEEAFVVGPGVSAPGKALYDTYSDWHLQSGSQEDPMSAPRFWAALEKRGFRQKRTMHARLWLGIKPKSAVDLADDDE